MGLFSKIFGGGKSSPKIVSGKNPGKGWTEANKFNKARGGRAGGYGAWTFSNIMNAHCSVEDIVDTFRLDKDDNAYECDAYLIAYQECYDDAFKEYEDLMGFYMELIEMNQSIIYDNEIEIAELEAENEELNQEIEELQDELDFLDDPFEMEEIMEEIQELRAIVEENEIRIEELHAENTLLNEEIMSWYSEMEMVAVEDFIDIGELELKAYQYACEFAQDWYDGATWIPSDVLDWGYYTISSHNG